jgi:hypothetical protein
MILNAIFFLSFKLFLKKFSSFILEFYLDFHIKSHKNYFKKKSLKKYTAFGIILKICIIINLLKFYLNEEVLNQMKVLFN